MGILVCIKQVPGSNKVEVDPVTGVLKRDGSIHVRKQQMWRGYKNLNYFQNSIVHTNYTIHQPNSLFM